MKKFLPFAFRPPQMSDTNWQKDANVATLQSVLDMCRRQPFPPISTLTHNINNNITTIIKN